VRFKHVEKLIADDRYKQYEIAEMVGYKDFGYYIKVFKKRYGITPNEFRKHI
jgi:YesN/AraC family two-component response regulator